MKLPLIIDGLQYCNWSESVFHQMRAGGVTAVHVTICYHENFRETLLSDSYLQFTNLRFDS